MTFDKIHELNQKGIENMEHSVQRKRMYHRQAIKLAKELKRKHKDDVLYYELAHAYAHQMLVNRNLFTKFLPMVKMVFYTHKSLNINPQNDRTLYLAGAIAYFFRQSQKAEEYYKKSLLSNPHNLLTAKSLSFYLYDVGRKLEAVSVIKQGLHVQAKTQAERRRQVELASLYMRIDSTVVFAFKKYAN
ncbi:hypothetical protein [Fructobacillus durionis]|uniref:Uncharacterized protein n=1 Tax=Fructobacillus durionis TaxID=283737 RepID=A0A1I1H3E0_9LACO|nr:hypothetical protein [Fructobacillus durionis]SFC18062.1 hypothetical protein SAMN05660453_1238 [Fructobacillus durionis]